MLFHQTAFRHMTRSESLQPGTVTRLETQKNNPDRLSVYLNDQFAFGLHREIASAHDLSVGRSLSVQEQRTLLIADETRRAKEAALRYLSHKDRTEHEVRRNLSKKDFGEEAIDEAVHRLHELNYLDDADYAERYARERFERKGYGARRIQHELRRRGVDRRHIENALAEVVERDEALQHARSHAEKRLSRLEREPNPWKRRRKLSDYLRRRGFDYELIRQVVREVAEREEW